MTGVTRQARSRPDQCLPALVYVGLGKGLDKMISVGLETPHMT